MKAKKMGWKENLLSMGKAIVFVLMIRSSVVEAFKIPSGSMIPTLFVGDKIFVSKFAYGFKVPFFHIYPIKRKPPERGDVIVFQYPKDKSMYYIKRVIGIPGDRVKIQNKKIYINDQEVIRNSLSEETIHSILEDINDSKYPKDSFTVYQETLEGKKYHILQTKTHHFNSAHQTFTVPAKKYFVMGDNRDFSNDSRYWGFVPEYNIQGKAFLIWACFDFHFFGEKNIFKLNRIGKWIF